MIAPADVNCDFRHTNQQIAMQFVLVMLLTQILNKNHFIKQFFLGQF